MGGFTYRRVLDASQAFLDPSQRTYLLLDSEEQRVGSFVVPDATGAVAVTGLGFQPDVVIFTFAARLGTGLTGTRGCSFSVGCAGADAQWAYGVHVRHGVSTNNLCRWHDEAALVVIRTTGIHARAVLASLDSDGFTLDVEENTLGQPITVRYLALKGAFKVGTSEIPVATGMQEVGGIGFQPKGLWLACAPGEGAATVAHPVYTRGGWDVMNAFLSPDARHVVWGGAKRSAGPNWSSTMWKTQAFFLGLPFGVRAQADLDAFLPDSFRLNWTQVDAVADYRYGYLAADEGEAGSFQIVSHNGSVPLDVDVPARLEPKAMLSSSTGVWGLGTGATREVLPDEHMMNGMGYLGLGADVPWELSALDEVSAGIAQSSGGPSGGSYPTAGAYSDTARQGRSWFHDTPAGDVVMTLGGQAFDVWKTRPRIVGMNWRYADRRGVNIRGLHGTR